MRHERKTGRCKLLDTRNSQRALDSGRRSGGNTDILRGAGGRTARKRRKGLRGGPREVPKRLVTAATAKTDAADGAGYRVFVESEVVNTLKIAVTSRRQTGRRQVFRGHLV